VCDGDSELNNVKRYGNKIYDATDEKTQYGVTIYQQRDDNNKVIEYWEPTKIWQWKKKTSLGTNKCSVREFKPKQGAHPDIKTVTEVQFSPNNPDDAWSEPFKVTITPIAPPVAPEPLLPSSADVELFWMMCEAILQFPALAKADGLIKSKEDLMDVLLKKRYLADEDFMSKVFTYGELFKLFVSSAPASSKKRPRDE
jgi:hypothetical protein